MASRTSNTKSHSDRDTQSKSAKRARVLQNTTRRTSELSPQLCLFAQMCLLMSLTLVRGQDHVAQTSMSREGRSRQQGARTSPTSSSHSQETSTPAPLTEPQETPCPTRQRGEDQQWQASRNAALICFSCTCSTQASSDATVALSADLPRFRALLGKCRLRCGCAGATHRTGLRA